MTSALVPIGRWLIAELDATIATEVIRCWRKLCMTGNRAGNVGWICKIVGGEECSGIILGEDSAGPRVTPEMKGVLVALSFILVLEAIVTVCAAILFLGFVLPKHGLA